jgi:hypothetical protein
MRFVEIPSRALSSVPECAVELQDRRGRKLRVELRDPAGAEALARSLWSNRR